MPGSSRTAPRIGSLALLATLLAACGGAPTPAPTATPASSAASVTPPEDRSQLPFVGKVWMASMPGSALGSMLIFLPDGTLVMDSCFETYRLSKWGMAGERVRWLEDTIPIEADIKVIRNNELRLRIGGMEQERVYVTASVPYTCPSMPR